MCECVCIVLASHPGCISVAGSKSTVMKEWMMNNNIKHCMLHTMYFGFYTETQVTMDQKRKSQIVAWNEREVKWKTLLDYSYNNIGIFTRAVSISAWIHTVSLMFCDFIYILSFFYDIWWTFTLMHLVKYTVWYRPVSSGTTQHVNK